MRDQDIFKVYFNISDRISFAHRNFLSSTMLVSNVMIFRISGEQKLRSDSPILLLLNYLSYLQAVML